MQKNSAVIAAIVTIVAITLLIIVLYVAVPKAKTNAPNQVPNLVGNVGNDFTGDFLVVENECTSDGKPLNAWLIYPTDDNLYFMFRNSSWYNVSRQAATNQGRFKTKLQDLKGSACASRPSMCNFVRFVMAKNGNFFSEHVRKSSDSSATYSSNGYWPYSSAGFNHTDSFWYGTGVNENGVCEPMVECATCSDNENQCQTCDSKGQNCVNVLCKACDSNKENCIQSQCNCPAGMSCYTGICQPDSTNYGGGAFVQIGSWTIYPELQPYAPRQPQPYFAILSIATSKGKRAKVSMYDIGNVVGYCANGSPTTGFNQAQNPRDSDNTVGTPSGYCTRDSGDVFYGASYSCDTPNAPNCSSNQSCPSGQICFQGNCIGSASGLTVTSKINLGKWTIQEVEGQNGNVTELQFINSKNKIKFTITDSGDIISSDSSGNYVGSLTAGTLRSYELRCNPRGYPCYNIGYDNGNVPALIKDVGPSPCQ